MPTKEFCVEKLKVCTSELFDTVPPNPNDMPQTVYMANLNNAINSLD